MFGEGEGLESSVKFAVTATYDKFNRKWGLPTEKLKWVDIWSPFLSKFSIAVINRVSDYCIHEFPSPPVPAKFIELATKATEGRSLSEPIASKAERMAYLILASDDFKGRGISNSELSDACLIAAAIAHQNSYAESLPNTSPEYILQEIAGRSRMFAKEVSHWKKDAHAGKGYWQGVIK